MDVSTYSPTLTLRRISAIGVPFALLTTLFVYRFFTTFTLLGVGLSIGLLLFAALGREDTGRFTFSIPLNDPRVPGILLVVFLLANIVAVLSLSTAYYSKPVLYYAAIAVAAGVLVARITLTAAHRSNVALAFLYGLNTFISNQLAFPLGLNGPDVGDHIGLATTIYRTGHITGGSTYTGFPGQHLLAATSAFFAGTPVPITYRSIGILAMVLGLPVTYLIARRLGNRRYAVFAIIFYASMDYVVYRAGHPSKLAYALPLVLLTVATVSYLYKEGEPGLVVLFGLFSTALVFTHPHTAFITLILLGAIAVGSYLASRVDAILPSSTTQTTNGGRSQTSVFASRSHVFVLLFAIVFIGQFLYFSQFFQNLVDIAYQYVDILLLTGGTDAVKATPRFSSIPQAQLFINTIGSGLLTLFVVVGSLNLLSRRIRLSHLLMTWTVVSGAVMVLGVVGNVPFALPNRVWVITEITAFSFFGAAGLLYCLQQAQTRSQPKVLVSAVIILVIGFAFFSTASTIAGIETSAFNEDVPHRTWYGMVEAQASDGFLEAVGVNTSTVRAARTFPVETNRAINYSNASSEIVSLNLHKTKTGIPIASGATRIGSGAYAIPQEPRNGLSKSSRFYDNGPIELYRMENASG